MGGSHSGTSCSVNEEICVQKIFANLSVLTNVVSEVRLFSLRISIISNKKIR